MPYIIRPGTVQATDLVDPGVQDVYSSPNVFVNNVPVALWEAPQTSTATLNGLVLPIPAPVADYAPTQAQKDNYASNQALAELNPVYGPILGGPNDGKIGATTGGDAIPPGTADPNDPLGNPELNPAGITLAAGDSIWGRLENYLNQCDKDQAAWREQTPPGSIAPNYVSNPNIMNAFIQSGFPKPVLDRAFPGPGKGAPGDQVYWCAAYAGLALKTAGATSLKTLGAKDYAALWPCTKINVLDKRAWRRNDLVFFSFSHVSFIRQIKDGRAFCTGGNQSNTVCTQGYALNSIAFVGRQWDVPAEYDKPMV